MRTHPTSFDRGTIHTRASQRKKTSKVSVERSLDSRRDLSEVTSNQREHVRVRVLVTGITPARGTMIKGLMNGALSYGAVPNVRLDLTVVSSNIQVRTREQANARKFSNAGFSRVRIPTINDTYAKTSYGRTRRKLSESELFWNISGQHGDAGSLCSRGGNDLRGCVRARRPPCLPLFTRPRLSARATRTGPGQTG